MSTEPNRGRRAPTPKWWDRLIVWLLRTRMHRIVGGSLAIVEYEGRRSGAQRSVVVIVARSDNRVVIHPARPAGKTWWRNLVGGADVALVHRGVRRDGRAQVLAADDVGWAAAADLYRASHARARIEEHLVTLDLVPAAVSRAA